jgi:hypothetical protein
MSGLLSAWLVSMGILSWKQVTQEHEPPVPGSLVAVSLVFALLGIVGEWNSGVAALTGWGLVTAQAISYAKNKSTTTANTATTPAGATAAANL